MSGLKVKFSRKQICHCPLVLSFCQMAPMGFDLHPQGLLELYSLGSQVPLLQQWSWDGNLLVPSLWILEEYVCLPWSKILLPTENDMSQLPRDGVVRAEDPGSSHLPSTEASAKPYHASSHSRADASVTFR